MAREGECEAEPVGLWCSGADRKITNMLQMLVAFSSWCFHSVEYNGPALIPDIKSTAILYSKLWWIRIWVSKWTETHGVWRECPLLFPSVDLLRARLEFFQMESCMQLQCGETALNVWVAVAIHQWLSLSWQCPCFRSVYSRGEPWVEQKPFRNTGALFVFLEFRQVWRMRW